MVESRGKVGTRRRTRSLGSLGYRVLKQVWGHPSNSHAPVKALCRAVAWQARKRLSTGPVRIQAYGLDLIFPRDSGSLSNYFYFGERFEWVVAGFLRAYLRPGDIVVDAGANVGMFAYLAWEAVAPDGQVVAFEPSHLHADVIRNNVVRNHISDHVVVHAVAVGQGAGTAIFTDDVDVSNHLEVAAQTGQSSQVVPVVRIDDACDVERVAVIKLDVEGAEYMALQGCQRLLHGEVPPILIVEAHDHALKRLGSSRDAVIALLADWGYQPVKFDERSLKVGECEWHDVEGDAILAPMDCLGVVEKRLRRWSKQEGLSGPELFV